MKVTQSPILAILCVLLWAGSIATSKYDPNLLPEKTKFRIAMGITALTPHADEHNTSNAYDLPGSRRFVAGRESKLSTSSANLTKPISSATEDGPNLGVKVGLRRRRLLEFAWSMSNSSRCWSLVANLNNHHIQYSDIIATRVWDVMSFFVMFATNS